MSSPCAGVLIERPWSSCTIEVLSWRCMAIARRFGGKSASNELGDRFHVGKDTTSA
jgi:hypothetical protein